MKANGQGLIQLFVSIVVAGIAMWGAFSVFRTSFNAGVHFGGADDLQSLRNDALNRLDCQRSMAAPCSPKDKNGQPWPNANGMVGNYLVSSVCSTTGIAIMVRIKPTKSDFMGGMGGGSTNANNTTWLPLFDQKPTLCEATAIPPSGGSSGGTDLPYYEVRTYPLISDCSWGCDFGDDHRTGCITYGTAPCRAGYDAVGGGSSCGVTTSTANWAGTFLGYPGGLGSLGSSTVNSVTYKYFTAACCPVSHAPGTISVICIRRQ